MKNIIRKLVGHHQMPFSPHSPLLTANYIMHRCLYLATFSENLRRKPQSLLITFSPPFRSLVGEPVDRRKGRSAITTTTIPIAPSVSPSGDGLRDKEIVELEQQMQEIEPLSGSDAAITENRATNKTKTFGYKSNAAEFTGNVVVPDVEENDTKHWSLYIQAAMMGNVTDIESMLGADFSLQRPNGNGEWTPLMHAAMAGHTDCVLALLKGGADVNDKDWDGWTALMHVSMAGFEDIIDELISAGADVDATSDIGGTALMNTAAEGHFGAMHLLLQAGADPSKVDADGLDALDYAIDEENERCATELEIYMPAQSSPPIE